MAALLLHQYDYCVSRQNTIDCLCSCHLLQVTLCCMHPPLSLRQYGARHFICVSFLRSTRAKRNTKEGEAPLPRITSGVPYRCYQLITIPPAPCAATYDRSASAAAAAPRRL